MEGAVSKLGKAMVVAGAAVTTAAVAIGYESVKAAVSFQASMTKIQTQAGASAKDVKTLSAAVLNMKDVQQGPQQLADSLFHLKSVGLSNVQAMKALKTASDLAAVGGANLEDTTNALAGAWRSGIKGAQNFGQTASTLNAIVGAGNMRMGDLVEAMGTGFLPSARSFGLSLKSVGAALALMTDEGIPANVAATRLRMTFSLLGAPTAKAAGLLKTIGLSSTALATAMRSPSGIVGAVGLLKSHLDSSGLSLTKQAQLLSEAFGGGRSSSAILTLLNNYTVLEKKQKQINDTLGKYGPAVEAQRKTASAQLAILTSTLDTLAIKIGNVLLPFLVTLAKTANTVLLPALGKVTTAFLAIIPVAAIEKDWDKLLSLFGAGPKPVHVPVVPVLPSGGAGDLFGTAKPSPVSVVPYLPGAARNLFGNTAKPVPVAVIPFLPGGGAPKSLFAAKPVRVPVVPYVAGGGPRNLFGSAKPVPVRVAPVPAVPFVPGGAGKSLFGTAKPLPVPVAPFLPGGAPKSLFTGMPVPVAVVPFTPSGGPQFSSATLFGKGAAPKAATGLAATLGAALSKVDWGKVISTAIQAAVSIQEKIGAAILTLLGKINWVQVGKQAAVILVPFVISLVSNLAGALISEAVHHPLDMLAFFGGLIVAGRAAGIIAKLFGKIKVLGPLVRMFTGPLVAAGSSVESALGKFLGKVFGPLGSKITGYFSGAKTWLAGKGDDIMLGLMYGIDGAKKGVSSALSGLKRLFVGTTDAEGVFTASSIGSAAKSSAAWVVSAAKTVGSFAAMAAGSVTSAAKTVGSFAVSSVASAVKSSAAWVVSAAVTVASFVAMAAAATAAFIAENLATLGIAAGIAALVAGIVYLATHWSTVWGAVKKAFADFEIWILEGLRAITGGVLGFFGMVIDGAAHLFGWLPGIGGLLKTAAASFGRFKSGVNSSFSNMIASAQDWRHSLDASQSGFAKATAAILGSFTSQQKAAGHAQAALSDYTRAVKNNQQNTDAGKGARAKLIRDLESAGLSAQKAQGLVGALSRSIRNIPSGATTHLAVEGTGVWKIGQAPLQLFGKAAGGLVTGGTPGRDSVPIMAMPGELVVPTPMVAAGAVDHLRGRLPGFAAGGLIGPSPGLTSWTGKEEAASRKYADVMTQNAMIKAINAAAKAAAAKAASGGGPGGMSSGSAVSLGRALAAGRGWTGAQFDALNKLWTRESGWRWNADNASSGAYGIPQALPGSKMASAGGDWRTNPATQIRWGLGYIAGRYGSPIGAWAHETSAGWYAKGTTGAKPGWAWVGERGKELVHFTGGETVLDATSSMRVTRGYAAGTPEIGLPPRKGTAWADAIAAGLNKIPQVLLSASIWKDLHKLISTLVARQKDKKTSDDAPPWLLRYTQKADLSLGRLGKAAQKLAATISAAKSYASGTTSTLSSFGDISGMDRTGLVTGSGIQSYYAGQAGIIGQFSANLKKLHAAGVSRTVIGQIIALGPADGNTVAAAILAAPGQITGINKAAADVAKLATAGGQTAADLMYDSGKQAGKGFLSGLEGQQKAIAAAMRRIARLLVNELRKELKIKSPSMVTHEIGTFAAMGLELGALSRLANVQSAASLLASAAVPRVPAATYTSGGGAGTGGNVTLQPQFDVRVFVGNQEITDIARTEIRAHDRQLIRMAKSGTGNAG